MIKKIRRKIIIITMLSIITVITIIIGTINILNYNRLVHNSSELVNVIYKDKGMFAPNDGSFDPKKNQFGPEAKFQTRYFVIVVDKSNNIISKDFSHIARVDESMAEEYKNKVLKSNHKFIDNYYYEVLNDEIIFLDCERELDTFYNFLFTSVLISVGGCFVVFILIVILSKIVVKPFYLNELRQKQFIADASHELKTPLTIINADVELIEITNGESEWLNSIKNQTSRLANITSQLTSLAKLDELAFALSKINISDILKEAINDISILFDEDSITQNIEDNVFINGNEELIKELFSILLENAYKYSKENVSIELNTHNKNVNLLFFNPVELEDGNYDYLFDRFYRLDNSRNSDKGGSGLGLSIARQIVTINNGKVRAYVNNKLFYVVISFKML